VNYESFESEISNKNSKFYYPDLMKRLKNYDTTLTKDDYFYLYYGYSCQPEYHPYGIPKYIDEYMKFAKAKDEPGVNDSIIKYSQLVLDEYPFLLKYYSMIAYMNHLKGNDNTTHKVAAIQDGLINAMMSTGDGLTEETAIHVLYTTNEYELIKVFGFDFKSQALLPKMIDVMTLEKNEAKVDVLYFDVSRLFEKNPLRKKK
jgi:hypothetical protein